MVNYFTSWIQKKPHIKGDLLTFIVSLSVALGLYLFGLRIPESSRITGDARQYMEIASSFDGLATAFQFVGERTSGMPIFDWLFRPSQIGASQSLQRWANSVCVALFLIHLFVSLMAVKVLSQLSLVRSRLGLRVFYMFLSTFPALIGHTTTPLTDTLAVDLSIVFLFGMVWCQKRKGMSAMIAATFIGLVAAYACLVRPAYLIPIIVALFLFTVILVSRNKHAALISVFVFSAWLGWTSDQCYDLYGRACLQDPKTFNAIPHAHMGLLGGRLLWGGPYPSNGEFPIVPDKVMKVAYYDRCQLNRIIGFDQSSLLGCLLGRPELIPVYVAKKWIGLFDHFRFQPYLESETPSWLVLMSRSYDSIALVGFLFSIVVLMRLFLRSKNLQSFNPALSAYLVFVFMMLAEHTILHPEDRFGLVLVPVAAVGFIMFGERLLHYFEKKERIKLVGAMVTATMVVAVFVWQIITWDRTHF